MRQTVTKKFSSMKSSWTYMAGLNSDTDKVDEKLRSEVVSQLNNIRAGLNKQQQGIAMQREALEQVTL